MDEGHTQVLVAVGSGVVSLSGSERRRRLPWRPENTILGSLCVTTPAARQLPTRLDVAPWGEHEVLPIPNCRIETRLALHHREQLGGLGAPRRKESLEDGGSRFEGAP